jgi:CRP-like cAMP-binding protein
MMERGQVRRPTGNRLLDSLNEDSWAALAGELHRIELGRKDTVGERGGAASHVIFPCGAVLSVLAFMENGAAVEVATVGREGVFGIESLLGAAVWTETTLCQIEGAALRMNAAVFRDCIADDPALQELSRRYLVAYLAAVSQSVACNRLHNIESRFARWILMTHDRVNEDSFYLTQEFIADMLGVQRPSVSIVAAAFQKAGIIKYARGSMTILDRKGLEQASCECYDVVARAFASLCVAEKRPSAPRSSLQA